VLEVVARGAEQPRELVIARVADVAADVAPSEKCFWYAFSDPQQLLFITIVTTPMPCRTAVSSSWAFIR